MKQTKRKRQKPRHRAERKWPLDRRQFLERKEPIIQRTSAYGAVERKGSLGVMLDCRTQSGLVKSVFCPIPSMKPGATIWVWHQRCIADRYLAEAVKAQGVQVDDVIAVWRYGESRVGVATVLRFSVSLVPQLSCCTPVAGR